ncbi:ABC transporter ATP-binding protein, partial [Phytoactinopolyspora endophytica]|uniref:ABC transporter ATP-binding protein n=1 Tax=Phytoactinopolyspora endophytica TaxID=1642495 RepID=UPI00197BA97E
MRLFTATLLATIASCLGLIMPLVLRWMVDGPLTRGEPSGVWLGGLALFLIGAAEAAIFGVRRWLVARPLAEVEASMRTALYRHLQRLPIPFHDRWPSGQLLSRGTADLGLLHGFLALSSTFLIVNGVTMALGCVILLTQQWTLGLVLLAPALPLTLLSALFEARYALVTRRAQDQNGNLTTVIEESILGIRVIKGFGRHESQVRAFQRLARQIHGTELHKARLFAGLSRFFVTLPEIAVGTTLVLGAVQVADGTLSSGTLLAFLATALVLRPVVESTGALLAMCNQAATAADRYFDIMDTPVPPDSPERHNLSTRPGSPVSAPRRATVSGPAGLAFDKVEFRYPDALPGAPAVLQDVDLRIAAGETVALVGATGSGKTTLACLVPRLYEVTGGRITLGGRDIAEMPVAELRASVGVGFEDPTLFSGSVADNVLLGGEAVTAADCARALTIARADDFVAALPNGEHTDVG